MEVKNLIAAFFILAGFILIPVTGVFATELYDRYTSVRALGMGNSFMPVADGIDALFYNPAGLASTGGITITPVKLKVGADDVTSLAKASDFNSDFSGTLRSFYGQVVSVTASETAGVAIPGFAVAGYDSANVTADLSNPALPNFRVNAINDTGVAAGFGLNLGPFLKWGVVGKKIYRFGGSMDLPVSAIASLNDTLIKQQLENYGVGTALDSGVSLSFPSPVKPTFSFVWRDIGDTSFVLNRGVAQLPTDKSEMAAAFGLEVSLPLLKIMPTVEYRYLTNSDIQIGKKINGGIEVQLPGLSLRGGLHQGYYTAGAGLNLGLMRLDLATYGVELGQYAGQHEDRRYVLELTIDFGFDFSTGSFMGINLSNDRGRLKERR